MANSGSAATKAVARLVLLDNSFSHLPTVVAEGRRVIANIERVSMLFLTKTVYATALALIFGIMIMQIPFLPRQLSITDGLTIGIPAFFLALLPNAQRYVPGFLRRSLTFAIPAGLVVALSLTVFARVCLALGVPAEELRAGTPLIVGIVGIWVLSVLARPLTWVKALIVAAMVAGFLFVMTFPLTVEFFELVEPRAEALWWVGGISAVAIVMVEIIRAVQLRVVQRRALRRATA